MVKQRIIRNEEGSSLTLVILGLLVMAIVVVSYQTVVASYVNRTYDEYFEQQAYLSARSVASAIGQSLESDSETYILTLDNDEKQAISGLPSDLLEGSSDIVLTQTQKTLLDDLADLEIEATIDLGEVTFDSDSVELESGTVEVEIKKELEDQYLIQATCFLQDCQETVQVVLSSTNYESSGGGQTGPTTSELDGNWDGFFFDYGIGVGENGSFGMNSAVDNLASGAPLIFDGGNQRTPYLGDKYSDGDIILTSTSISNGTVQSQGNITLSDTDMLSSLLVAKDTITIKTVDRKNTDGNTTTRSDTLIIDCEQVTFSGGTLEANTIYIDGTNITNYSSIICDTLYISGTGHSINNVKANTIYIDGSLSTFATITASTIEMSASTVIGGTWSVYTPNGTVTKGGVETPFGMSSSSITTIPNIEVEITPTIRTKPTWANYQAGDIQVYEEENGSVAQGYYRIEDTSITKEYVETQFVDGVLQQVTTVWNVLDGTTIGYTDGPAIYFIIEDGQNIEITKELSSKEIYFILEGNAKLKLSGTNYNCVRIYGEPTSSSIEKEIDEKIALFIETTMEQAEANNQEVDFQALENGIESIMNTYFYSMSGLIVSNTAFVQGSIVVPYMQATSAVTFKKEPYPDDSDKLTEDDFLNFEEEEEGVIPPIITGSGKTYVLYKFESYRK